ncbi:MAG: hypothetical protein BGO43_09700 [Gammaproteobacteria bacterium 39-13]|nr:class I SAM-dependent methyltransferase [Gammaproteobacteria bacterium]OJV93913.1 MAG: hypothetical protein BGO43_09700 [Gammaproteobacteria bacterium 39-13]
MMKNIFKNQALKLLKNLEHGSIKILEGKNEYSFVGKYSANKQVTVIVNDPKVYNQLVLMGTNGISHSYFHKGWECNSLKDLFDIILENKSLFKKMDHGFAKLYWIKDALLNLIRLTTFDSAKRNVLRHYDLSNDFFKQFLDNKMMYSCAIFEKPDQTLDEAAELKLKKVCEKLKLTEKDHLLEIGSGWGGLAIYAHLNYGCKVTTTTISNEQFNYVDLLIKEKNLSKSVQVLNKDYRHIEGIYDKIVSVEMIEAVGFKLFRDFFKRMNQLLRKEGFFLLQCITINDDDYERAKLETDFIKRYIFPGGCLPSVAAIQSIIKKDTQFKKLDFEDIGHHYVKTLSEWQKKFNHNLKNIFSLGFNESFARMWEYYFSYCQAGFQNKHISNIQVLWQKNC